MPLPKRKRGQSKQEHAGAVISKLRKEGKDEKQAVAIGLKTAGIAKKKKKKKG